MSDTNTPDGTGDDTPLSLSEAVRLYSSTPEAEDVEDDQIPEEDALVDEEADTLADDGEADGDEDGEDEQADAGDDDEEEADEDDGEDGEQVAADDAKVKLDDGRTVTIAELKKGTLLQADYTRKTQELGEQRRALETQSSQTQQLSQTLQQDRAFMVQVLQQIMPPMPPRDLLQTDPAGYMIAKDAHEAAREQLGQLLAQQQREDQHRQTQTQQERQQKLQREHAALVEALPELKDENRYKALFRDIAEVGPQYGLTPNEIKSIDDSRFVRVLRDAIAYRKLQAEKPKAKAKVEGRPPVQKGGKRLSHGQVEARERKAAMDRLNKSGSLKDGVRAFLASQKG